MKLASAVALALMDHGVRTLFGVAGDTNLPVIDSFCREHSGTYVAAGHEAGAVLMALGFSAVSREVGVATVTRGPGLTNAFTALTEGVRGSTPMVLVCGDSPSGDLTHPQEIDHREVAACSGAGFVGVLSPASALGDVARAFRRSIVERRPIVLNIPRDMLGQEAAYGRKVHRIPVDRAVVPASPDLDDAVGIIAAAKRPIILAGHGAAGAEAKAALLRLAARTDAFLATTLRAKDLFAGERFDIGIFGSLSTDAAVEVIIESDCVVAFGASMNRFTTGHGKLLSGKRVVQVDLSPAAIDRHLSPGVGLVGDAALTAEAILHWLDEAEIPPSGFRNGARAAEERPHAAPPSGAEGTVHITTALKRLDAALPADRVLVTDGGRFMAEAWKHMHVPGPASFVKTTHFGAVGMGMPYAIGAAAAKRDRPVILVAGDGGFMLGGLSEFNSAVRDRSNIIVVLCNDGSYGAEYVQLAEQGIDPGIMTFRWPEFAGVAQALGGTGFTVRSDAELEAVIARLPGLQGPVLIDIKIDPDRVPPLH
ncbi:thiamine pyrophosphate-binding protein [Roseomonas sp. KE2513]|uniref:thiamine pyrophosphate-binding protein n=1 Tax=Roseomonas sp. KE2513 TaxID=2479202 RepID=UPI0018DF1621|nr:thiamine pyrophosphate-binding protein [Roseomonas sp. KE2513]MBI0535245.1 thiamine pyrophosphate-binding protein [Roseomonas sp. KE2513]